MFMRTSGSSFCDSRSTSYFDRPAQHISRYRSDDPYRGTNSSSMAMTRKRPRPDSSHHYDVGTPRAHTSSIDLNASTSSFGLASPSPLVNTDYHLFGGLDTPGTWSEQREERTRMEDAERDYRQNRYSEKPSQSFFSDGSIVQKSQDDSNTAMSASTTLSGWHLRRTAWALTGGLAGKIFNFCWNTTFRGFQAGGGQAYNINDADDTDFAQDGHRFDPASTPRSRSDSSRYASHHQDLVQDQQRGRQAHDDHRPVKTPVSHQRHANLEDSAVKNNWVFVETTPTSPEERSPVRKKSRASVAGPGLGLSQYNSNNTNDNSTIPHRSTTYTAASFASPRSRTTSTHSRSHSYSNSYTAPNGGSTIAISPKPKRPRISMGYASPTKRQSTHILPQSPPISPEVEAFQRKRRKEAKKNDESLKRLNAQLQGMIREGQEALGSRIEVFEYGDGDLGSGSEDEDEDMSGGRYLR